MPKTDPRLDSRTEAVSRLGSLARLLHTSGDDHSEGEDGVLSPALSEVEGVSKEVLS